MSRAAVMAPQTDRPGNAVLAETPTPPAALFMPTKDEERELRRQQKEARQAAAEQASERNWRRIALWVLALIGWTLFALAASAFIVSLPLRRDHHHFTVLNDADHTAAVYASTWDLPESKREELILATAAQYVRACERYNWIQAPGDYAYCAGLSVGARRAEYLDQMRQNNPNGPQAKYGRVGFINVATDTPTRFAANAIRVTYIAVSAQPNTMPTCARYVMTLDYTPVQALPTTIKLQYPTADVLFFRATRDLDPTPAACGR